MVQGFMKEKFIQGVKTYLDEYKFANAETNDLWKHLSTVSQLISYIVELFSHAAISLY